MTAVTVSGPSQTPPTDPGPGVSVALAEDRAARVSNLRYELHFSIPESQQEPVRGRVTLRFDLTGAQTPLALDFAADRTAISGGRLNGEEGRPGFVTDHLVIPSLRHLPTTYVFTELKHVTRLTSGTFDSEGADDDFDSMVARRAHLRDLSA